MAPAIRAAAAITAAAALALTAFAAAPAGVQDLTQPPAGFSSGRVAANGTTLHYVRGGQGPAVVLIHGFPEDWNEYRPIMPRLAQRFTVVAVDLPGIGRSSPTRSGHDAEHRAADIHALVRALGLDRPYVVGHDLGGVTTYAYIRQFAGEIRGAMILDVPIPGLKGWDESTADFWHIRFIQEKNQLAEKLVVGRQKTFLDWSFAIGKFSSEEKRYYAKAYGPAQLHEAFEIYRAFPKDGEWNSSQTSAVAATVVVAVGENSFFGKYLDTFVEGMRAKGVTQVTGARIPGANHYVVADNPGAVTELIEQFAGR